jgi:Cys-tRNA synthase (O-phospho-L-seryl-tRNA:Cys-tRNA synthase)
MELLTKKNVIIAASILLAIIILFTVVIIACSKDVEQPQAEESLSDVVTEEPQTGKPTNTVTIDKDIYVIDTLTDANGYVIQKTVFNTITKHTYIYTFTYDANALGIVCTKSSVVIVNQDGTISVPPTGTEPTPDITPVN